MGQPSTEVDKKKELEEALDEALKKYFPPLEPASNARVQFYNKFQLEADAHDHEFLEKYNGDLDTLLIFAALFSAIPSAFILAIQMQLQPDYTQLTYDVLFVMANHSGLTLPPKPSSDSPWTVPDPNLVHIQSILFSSLAASVLAAFVAMLGKQWLNRYTKVDKRGNFIERSRYRQRKINGMSTWGFGLVMESLPLMLQGSLLLLGYALSSFLFTIDTVVAAVVVGFTGAGLLFYGVITLSAIISYDCPFQTPPSLIIRFFLCLFQDREKNLKKFKRWIRCTFFQKKKQQIQDRERTAGGHEDLAMAPIQPFDRLPTLFDDDTKLEGHVLDSRCIAWMFDMSMDADVTLEIIKFIPEVVWHQGIAITPLETLYDTVVQCFDLSSTRPAVIAKFKNKAYLSAKALLHVAIQRKCVGNEFDNEALNSIIPQYRDKFMEPKDCRGDSDLESTLGIIDRVFGHPEKMCWDNFTLTGPHHTWMSHILLYRATYALEEAGPTLPDDIRQFILYSFRRDPSLPIVLNCVLIIGLVLGIDLNTIDRGVTDNSEKIKSQINRIYRKLSTIFQNPNSTAEIVRALEALRLIVPLSMVDVAIKSYNLFHVVMQAPATPEKWEASRLALHGAYKWGEPLPWVINPQDILTFLTHHFELKNQEKPIENALHALAYACSPAATETLKAFDSTQPSFVRGVHEALQKSKLPQLQTAALSFLPLIGDRWFNTRDPIMEPEKMKALCKDWASAVDNVGLTTNHARNVALSVLFCMMDSPHWRPHIVKEKWRLLEHFKSVPDDSEPLKRCLGDPKLIDEIPNVGSPSARVLWLQILWLKYEGLNHIVQKKLETATKELPRGEADQCLSAVKAELADIETVLLKYETWSNIPAAVDLRKKKQSLEQSRALMMKR